MRERNEFYGLCRLGGQNNCLETTAFVTNHLAFYLTTTGHFKRLDCHQPGGGVRGNCWLLQCQKSYAFAVVGTVNFKGMAKFFYFENILK
jgi:hypothetical protein